MKSERIYCAFCKLQRWVYTKEHVSLINVFLCTLLSFVLMELIWMRWHTSVFVLIITLILISEFVIKIRHRMSLICPHCGFDPVLYAKDQESAALKVKKVLEEKKAAPEFLFKSNNPFEKINIDRKPLKIPETRDITKNLDTMKSII